MRRLLIALGLWALLMPLAARADGIDLTNRFGTVIFTDAGVVSRGSELLGFNGITAPPGRALGMLKFTTGALVSGDLWSGGTFSSVGSSFVVTSGGGGYGQPAKGIIFSGVFVGPISWTLSSHPGPWTYLFTLSGKITGQLWDGRNVTGTTTQSIFAYKNQWMHDHQGGIANGNANLGVPEPGTLGLLGTGLIAMAGTLRRKLLHR